MANTFPVSLFWNNVPTDVTYVDINQLGTIIAQQLQATVGASVSFFIAGPTLPVTNQNTIFYSTTTNQFYYWSTVTGSYLPIGFGFVTALPVTNQGYLFNTTNNTFYAWNGSSYSAISQIASVGDIKSNYLNADELALGWVLAAGSRTIDSIAGLTTAQNAALHTLFGAGAGIQVPNVTAPTSTVGGGGGGGGTAYSKIFCGIP